MTTSQLTQIEGESHRNTEPLHGGNYYSAVANKDLLDGGACEHRGAQAQTAAVGAIWRTGAVNEVRGAGGKAGAGTSIGTALHSGQVGSPDRGDEGVGGARPLPSSHVSMQDTWNCHASGWVGRSRQRAEIETEG